MEPSEIIENRTASRVSVWVIPTDQERTIARQTIEVLRAGRTARPSVADALMSDALSMEKQV